jgi:4-amino-4-deoxy-L-arabinose transferase-like glycosyltransferase
MEIPLYLLFGENFIGWTISLLLLDTLTCFLLMTAFRRQWGNRAALLAGLFYAVNLPIIYYTAKISQVTSMLPFIVLWFYLFSSWETAYRSRWLPWALGLISGAMILNKTVFLPVPFVCAGVLAWARRAEFRKIADLLPIALYLLVTLVVVSPWTARNFVVTKGKFVPVQCMFWELFVQDVLYYDLGTAKGSDRPEGDLLHYFLAREREILMTHQTATDCPAGLDRPQWEMQCEGAFAAACRQWIRDDPFKIMKVKVANLWNFWIRAENWSKTRALILMQIVYLGAAGVGLACLIRARQLDRVKYGLVLILVLWSEHCLVFAWGRFSLDLVPVLGLLFGLGIDAWMKQSAEKSAVP